MRTPNHNSNLSEGQLTLTQVVRAYEQFVPEDEEEELLKVAGVCRESECSEEDVLVKACSDTGGKPVASRESPPSPVQAAADEASPPSPSVLPAPSPPELVHCGGFTKVEKRKRVDLNAEESEYDVLKSQVSKLRSISIRWKTEAARLKDIVKDLTDRNKVLCNQLRLAETQVAEVKADRTQQLQYTAVEDR